MKVNDDDIIEPEGLPPSWEPKDVSQWLDGDRKTIEPALGARSDGVYLLYPGKMHTIFAESEAGKTSLALFWTVQEIEAGNHVWFIDLEDNMAAILGKLTEITGDEKAIRKYFHYISPMEPLPDVEDLIKIIRGASLIILDGVTEALTLQGLDSSNDSVAFYGRTITTPLAEQTGAAGVSLDHVAKDKATRGRTPIAGIHKLNGITGAAYTLINKEPFGRGRTGKSELWVAKDRPGHIRQLGRPGKDQMVHVADLEITNNDDTDETRITLNSIDGDGEFRPTTLMSRLSKAAEEAWTAGEQISRTGLAGKVTGNKKAKFQAINLLLKEGYLREVTGGRRRLIEHVKLFTHRKAGAQPDLEDII
jgi:hypothetical protein